MPYGEVERGSTTVVETISSHLPRNTYVTIRDDVAGVGSASFYQFAKQFTKHVRELKTGNREVLLTYYVYRSHLSSQNLLHFREKKVIVYALPSNTSGKTQTCDVKLFSSFKRELNKTISNLADVYVGSRIDIFRFPFFIQQERDYVVDGNQLRALRLLYR